jgi:hypothetical protein
MKGGLHINRTRSQGKRGKRYLRISAGPQRRRYVHQLVAEALLRRPLRPGEAVDHIDGNGLNNAPTNLRVLTVIGNSRKSTPPLLGETICDGRVVWEGYAESHQS